MTIAAPLYGVTVLECAILPNFYTAGVGLAIKNPLASIFRYRHAQKILASEILKNDFGAEL
jgi:hypothetical protein